MSLFDFDNYDNDVADLRGEVAAQRRREAMRLRHWCSECRGFTGRGSPCWEPPEEEQGDDE